MQQRKSDGTKTDGALQPNRTIDGGLACSFHEPWLGPHYLCQAAVEAITGKPAILPDHSAYAPKLLTAGMPEPEEWKLS